jgi:hypothetical protein
MSRSAGFRLESIGIDLIQRLTPANRAWNFGRKRKSVPEIVTKFCNTT